MTEDEIREDFKTVGMIAAMGVEFLSWDAGADVLTLRLPHSSALDGGAGTGYFHGGAIGALADTAATYALLAGGAEHAPTANYRVDFIRPATGSALTAKAQVRRRGRTLGIADIDVFNDADKLVATARSTAVLG